MEVGDFLKNMFNKMDSENKICSNIKCNKKKSTYRWIDKKQFCEECCWGAFQLISYDQAGRYFQLTTILLDNIIGLDLIPHFRWYSKFKKNYTTYFYERDIANMCKKSGFTSDRVEYSRREYKEYAYAIRYKLLPEISSKRINKKVADNFEEYTISTDKHSEDFEEYVLEECDSKKFNSEDFEEYILEK